MSGSAKLVTGIENGVAKAGSRFDAARLFLHGTTVAINTILERSGAKCALLTTQGFRDIYEIGRVNRPESYNLFFRRHSPLIERDLRFDISERIDAQGAVLMHVSNRNLELSSVVVGIADANDLATPSLVAARQAGEVLVVERDARDGYPNGSRRRPSPAS